MGLVRNWLTSRYEKIIFTHVDGTRYNLHDPAKKAVISMAGWGLPAAEIATTRGPFQHGVNPLTIRMPTREIIMRIRHNGCSREEYIDNRNELVDALRLNRTSLNNPSPGNLTWYRADGTVRQIDVFIKEGPDFISNSDGWDEFSYQDELRFFAPDPVIYDPTVNMSFSGSIICEPLAGLVFPFSFARNIIFNINDCFQEVSQSITYQGNWQSFPTILVTGPATNISIIHNQTGLKIALDGYTVPVGNSILFDLGYGVKTVTLGSSGESLLGYISDDSSLGSFALEPDPVVANGINTFTIRASNGNFNTQVMFTYYNKYIGI